MAADISWLAYGVGPIDFFGHLNGIGIGDYARLWQRSKVKFRIHRAESRMSSRIILMFSFYLLGITYDNLGCFIIACNTSSDTNFVIHIFAFGSWFELTAMVPPYYDCEDMIRIITVEVKECWTSLSFRIIKRTGGMPTYGCFPAGKFRCIRGINFLLGLD